MIALGLLMLVTTGCESTRWNWLKPNPHNDLADKYKLEPDGPNTLRLVEKATSPQGLAVRKVIVMNRKEVKAPNPQVTAFLLLDDRTGQEICSAHIQTTKVVATGAILPYKME